MVHGLPDWDRFASIVGGTIEGLGDRAVRAYGEMVDLLWRDGEMEAALRLEEMWNQLGRRYDFSLLCAYVMGNFYKEADREPFARVCRSHSRALPAEGYSQLEDADARLLEVSLLQQQARALETEIESRKQVEERLARLVAERTRQGEQSEERFRLLVDSVADYAIFMLHPDGRVATWNVGAERIKGYRADEIIGQHFSRFYTPEDIAAGRPDHMLATAAREGRSECEGYCVRKDGSLFFANVVISRIVDRTDGRLIGFAKVTRDLTQRRLLQLEQVARSAAEAERTRLYKVFLEAPIAIALTRGPDHVFELANPAYCALVGRTERELLDQPLRAALGAPLAGGDRAPLSDFDVLDEAYRSGNAFVDPEYPVRLARSRDGAREEPALRLIVEPLKDAAGAVSGLMAVLVDVTDQVRARAALEGALAEQEKVAELREQLIGVVGHDLRSPLSAIVVGANMLLKRGTLGEAESRTAARIARNADRMTNMISQLLDFTRSRLGGGIPIDPCPVDLAEVCREVIVDCEATHADRAITFACEGDPRGRWDRERLAQVAANLVGNAIQHGPEGGPVDVRLAGDRDAVRLRVHNGGPPIDAALLPTIFDPFRRGSSRLEAGPTGSLGLGLFIVREIARAHGGEVTVESTAEAGTTFTVTLPRTGPSSRSP